MTSTILRRASAGLLGAACVATTLTATAAPSSAGGAKSTSYPATWTFGEGSSVAGDLQRYPHLTDYASTEYYDRVTATPARGETVTVGGTTCLGGTYYQSGLSLFADPKNWANLDAGTANEGARVRIACTGTDGVIHHFHWGSYVDDPSANPETTPTTHNCMSLSRGVDTLGRTTFTVSAADTCLAQDRIVNNRGKVLDLTNTSLPFTATITVPGPGPVISSP